MLESFANEFTYQKLSKEEMEKRHILGRLVGIIADGKKPTRNGRLYSVEAWKKAFENDIMQEQIKNLCVLGELEHPDRDDIDPREACMCLAETPKIGKDGNLWGVFDILDLPNGRILNTLCEYGTRIGVSSRGSGDVVEDLNGDPVVEPSTFECTCWDAVLLPAVKAARPAYVKESLDKKKSLKESLQEQLDKAEDKEKEIMKKTLDNLQLLKENKSGIDTLKCVDINEVSKKEPEDKKLEVKDTESNKVVKGLQEALKSKVKLEKEIQSLQEKVAVSDAKTIKLQEELDKYKRFAKKVGDLSIENENLKKSNLSLKETIEEQTNTIRDLTSKTSTLVESTTKNSKSLKETLSKKDNEIKVLTRRLGYQEKENREEISKLNATISKLNESLKSSKEEHTQKLNKAAKLIEKYKGYVNDTINSYIDSKAVMLGVSANEIKNRLGESYTIKDIDTVCDSLLDYNLRISKLPFQLSRDSRIKMTESKQSQYQPISPEDDIEDLVEIMNWRN